MDRAIPVQCERFPTLPIAEVLSPVVLGFDSSHIDTHGCLYPFAITMSSTDPSRLPRLSSRGKSPYRPKASTCRYPLRASYQAINSSLSWTAPSDSIRYMLRFVMDYSSIPTTVEILMGEKVWNESQQAP